MWMFVPREVLCWVTGTGVVCLFPRHESWCGCIGFSVRSQLMSHLWFAGKSSPCGKGLSWGIFLYG